MGKTALENVLLGSVGGMEKAARLKTLGLKGRELPFHTQDY